MKYFILTTAVASLISVNAMASGFSEGWGGEASLSGSTTSGNTSTTDIGLALHLTKEQGQWEHKFDTTYDLGRAEGIDNKNRAYLGYQLNRQISERLYGYGNANYFTDDFGAFKNGSFVGGGLGYKAIVGEPVQWDLEGGAGYRSQKSREVGIDNLATAIPAMTVNEFALRGASEFDYQFSEAVSLYNDSEVIWSDSDTYLWNDIGITANLAGNLAARFSFRVDHHTDVAVGVKKTDTITRAALVYTLK
jgi:putative salt-induced outer membrane protein